MISDRLHRALQFKTIILTIEMPLSCHSVRSGALQRHLTNAHAICRHSPQIRQYNRSFCGGQIETATRIRTASFNLQLTSNKCSLIKENSINQRRKIVHILEI